MKFEARLADGRTLTEADFLLVSLLPLAEVVEIVIQADGHVPVCLRADVLKGERIHYFVRHTMPISNTEVAKLSVPVYEIRKDEKTLCRLYWHPEKGPLLATQDLYF